MDTIVVGYDGSEQSDRALARAVEIGKAMGAGLRVVRILEAATQSLAQRGRVIELEKVRLIA